VPSTRDPILLLEPSNLLEPLSLEDRPGDPGVPRLDRDGTAPPVRRRPPAAAGPRAGSGASRWRLKTALVVTGGVICFGAGVAMPALPSLIFGEVKHAPPVESAARPTAPAQVTFEAPKPTDPKLIEPKVTEPKVTEPKVTEPKVTEQPADPTPQPPPPPVQNAVPVRDSGELAGGPNETAPPRNAPAANQPAPVANQPAPAAKETVGSGVAAPPPRPQEERPAPRTRRVVVQPTDQVRAADNGAAADNVPSAGTANAAAPIASPGASPGERRGDRETNRGSSRRRDRTADYGRGSGSWERWSGEEPEQGWGERSSSDRSYRSSSGRSSGDRSSGDRSSGDRSSGDRSSGDRSSGDRSWRWGRDRYDDEGGEDRRAFGRAAREDDRPIGRGPRFGGPGFFQLLGGDD
jgi:hypothetical protein